VRVTTGVSSYRLRRVGTSLRHLVFPLFVFLLSLHVLEILLMPIVN
jgi:hypothetical protein